MVAVVVAIAAAGALAFVGATIANADRVVDVPRVTGMTVSQARVATAAAAHVDVADAPLVVGGRPYSESVPDGRIVSQAPVAAERSTERRSTSSSASVAARRSPRCRTSRERSSRLPQRALRAIGFAVRVRTEESWEIPEGRVISSDVDAGDEARRPGPIGIVVSSGPPRAPVPDVRGVDVDDATARLDGSFETDVVTEGSTTVSAGTVLRQAPAPGGRAVLGSTVTLTVARAPEWGTTWSESGTGDYDSAAGRGDRAPGRLEDRRRSRSALSDLRLGLGDRLVGRNRLGPDRSRPGRLRRRSRR